MTIKQQGGIFGRNPTFNNVTVDGTLTVDQIAEKTGAAGITLDGVTLKDGNVVLAAGKGIDFSATSGTGTSELFDDYEEGTWTPTLNATGFSGATYDAQTGTYTKIGDTVHAWAYVSLSALSSGGGNYLRIEGLPFSAQMTGAPSIVAAANLTGGTVGDYIVGRVFTGNSTINFDEFDENGQATALGMQGSRLTATSNFYVQVTFKV